MKGSDIYFFLNKLKIFGGVLAADQLCNIRDGKLYVVNTKPINHPGQHWVVYDNLKPKSPYFFDSFGNDPRSYKFFHKMKYSKQVLQSPSNETCGLWCIWYIYNRSKKFSRKKMFSLFTSDKKKNDKFILNWISACGSELVN